MSTTHHSADGVQRLGAVHADAVDVECPTCGTVVRCIHRRLLLDREQHLEVMGAADVCTACGYAVLAAETLIAIDALLAGKERLTTRCERKTLSTLRSEPCDEH
jgi:predicted RNA-binding Zn-ribbon protein involved in translation (DUF1610 family)